MLGKEFQKSAMRTNDHKSSARLAKILSENCGAGWSDKTDISIGGLINGCLGIAGEAGEFSDMVKKWIFHEKPLDREHLKKECGDICWYIAMICESMGWNLDDVLQMNVDKLLARYPQDQGFTPELANNRKDGDV